MEPLVSHPANATLLQVISTSPTSRDEVEVVEPALPPPAYFIDNSSNGSPAIPPILPLYSVPPRRATEPSFLRRIFASESSKTFLEPDITYLADGFRSGTMSHEEFCEWVLSSSASVRNAVVEDVTWWSAEKFPFHHQFVVVSIEYTPDDGASSMYNIVLERIGKTRGRHAQHRVTIHPAESVAEFSLKNQLLLGLFSTSSEEREGNPTRWSWISDLKKRRMSHFGGMPGFTTEQDERWRGPPATLGHLARFIQHIVASAPHYNVASTNCYYFSRLIVHAIALRHYSFSSVVWRCNSPSRYDKSTTHLVFECLTSRRSEDGLLFYERVLFLLLELVVILSVIGAIILIVKGFPVWELALAIYFGGFSLGLLTCFLFCGVGDIPGPIFLICVPVFLESFMLLEALSLENFMPGLSFIPLGAICLAQLGAWGQESLESHMHFFIKRLGTSNSSSFQLELKPKLYLW
ncbi:hypothetical protein DL93DRAFT_2166037 [Clavulina sp. PMI_390]|nr:hypothetical protein DL93DRAFT_2166037 [Clavulina sp. PMI_390]